ncbi:MAG TPA: PQQ-binding-like beta-propeller repeat protein [Pirellulaceae bacterium]|nr:PQQ-binding-like beta-propeller repeat protein [Pirellulaceae bacterium]
MSRHPGAWTALVVAVCLAAATAGCGMTQIPAQDNSPAADESAEQPAAETPVERDAPAEEKVATAPPEGNLWTRQEGADWGPFLGPTGDGKSPEKGILAPWPDGGLKTIWEKKLGTSYGAPAISQGRLYQFDRFGRMARVYCLKAETGEELWRYEYPTDYEDYYGYNNGPRCSPVVDGDRVYAYGAEGMLVCLNAITGKLVWKVDTAKDFGVVKNFFGVGSNPVVEGDLLLVMVGGSPPGTIDVFRAVGNGSGIVAFDKTSGEVKYKITDELASYASMKTATLAGRRFGLAFCRGGLVGFEPATGKVDFHFPWRALNPESVNASLPVVAGNEVFISETYGPGSALLSVAPGKCDVVWQDDQRKRFKAMQTHWNTPIEVDGYLYASSGRHLNEAELRCIEWQTGDIQWSEPDLTRASLTYIDGHFLVLGEIGNLLLVKANPRKYELVSEMNLAPRPAGIAGEGSTARDLPGDPFWAAPVVSHGLLYIRGGGKLRCLELIPRK